MKWLIWGAVVFTIGLFSKENQIIALGLIVILGIYKYKRENLFRIIIFTGVLSIISAIFIYARLNVLNFTGVIGLTGEVNPYTQHLWVRVVTFIHILPEYFKMMVFPWNLYYEKPYEAFYSIFNLQSLFGLYLIVVMAICAIRSIWRKSGYIFLGLGWFAVSMIPFTGILPLNAMYLEHWLYVPIIGIILCLCYWFEEMNEKGKKFGIYLLIFILILFSVRIIARNMEWGDPIKFYQNEIKYTDTSARIYTNLGMELADRGNCADAVPNYLKAISLSDSYPQTHHNLARCYEAMSKFNEAENEYVKALYIQPNFSYSLNNIINLLQYMKDKRSEKFMEIASRLENGGSVSRQDILNAGK